MEHGGASYLPKMFGKMGAYATPDGNLERLCRDSGSWKKIDFFVNAP
jgi:hypothetical protein